METIGGGSQRFLDGNGPNARHHMLWNTARLSGLKSNNGKRNAPEQPFNNVGLNLLLNPQQSRGL